MKFHGELADLVAQVEQLGLAGTWQENAEAGVHQFRAKSGEILNWWPRTGTLSTQGANSVAFKEAVLKVLGDAREVPQAEADARARIFVVHGHDREARDQLELVLRRLGLEPFILQNEDGGGRTIIEALEQNIYREAAFGVVLMTPDDFGYLKTESDADRRPRARQNVILELGMIMASLGRARIAILQKGALERPSDTDGILRIEFNDHVREIVPKLVQRFQAAGFVIDGAAIAAASA
ncbi:nucleotide-binding protein [Luteimonas sp. RD2P54]|uniref:Nucleotide-binding protein n=1 Tax=Luteimonas endophytica TaxID=3042023 RepID=A0ABT6JBT3_9GAMM|nr:nucleotide-binding protein [Luteimonas endophytica]MDH5824281.1 nucleotide-binding protein [Luteimonas endophytica]